MKKDPQVIVLCPGSALEGGVGTYILDMLREIKCRKMVITGPGKFGLNISSVDIVEIDGFDRVPTIKSMIEVIRTIKNETKKWRCVLILNSTAGLALAPMLRVLTSATVIAVFHGMASRYQGKKVYLIERFASLSAHKSILLTEHDRKYLKGKSATVIYNYCRNPALKTSNFRGPVISVARHAVQKNNQLLVDAAKLIPERKVKIYGGGNLYGHAMIQKREKRIDNLNLIEYEDRKNIYPGAALFVLSTFSEGFPLAVMEAASAGIPLLLSDLPELREVFGANARYFSNADPALLASKIENILGNSAEYAQLQKKALKIACSYTFARWRTNWRNVFQDLQFPDVM